MGSISVTVSWISKDSNIRVLNDLADEHSICTALPPRILMDGI